MKKTRSITLRVGNILRKSTDLDSWAQEAEDGTPRSRRNLLLMQLDALSYFKQREVGIIPNVYPDRLTNAQYATHFDYARPAWCECDANCGHITTYYTVGRPSGLLSDGTPNPNARISLTMLAIVGQTLVDSKHFARWLCHKSDLFAGFFFEACGPAFHGYAFFDIRGLGNDAIRARYDRMSDVMRRALAAYCQEKGAREIDSVSFLGRPVKKRYEGGRIVGVDGGVWMPLPRNAEDCGSIPLTETNDEEEWREGYRFESSIALELRHIEEMELAFPDPPGPLPAKPRDRPDSKTKRKPPEHTIVIRATPADYMGCAIRIMPQPIPHPKTRDTATLEDMAIFLMFTDAFRARPNPDGSMPFARYESTWRTYHTQGRISRAWKAERYKVIRDRLISCGLIVVIDSRYAPGRAMKWTVAAQFARYLDSLRE